MRHHNLSLCETVADEVKTSTCYMCACRCGINVYLKEGQIRYIEGNPDHPVNKGVLCAKGSAGIMQHLSPARLSKPLLRVGERGGGEFREIEWDEALQIATDKLSAVRASNPKRLAFFTGRDQSQSLTGWWAQQFGTPNYAAHGGFCSVNMAAGGFYSIGGSFWEFGEPDWQHTRYLLLFGVAEDHSSNPIKIGLSELKKRGGKCLSVNPVRTGYSAIADEWLSVRPGGDVFFVASLIHLLLKNDVVDYDYLKLYTNSPHLIIAEEGAADDGLFLRDENGNPYIFNNDTKKPEAVTAPKLSAALEGDFTVNGRRCRPAFSAIKSRFADSVYAPENTAEKSGVSAGDCHRIAEELTTIFRSPVEIKQSWTDAWGNTHNSFKGCAISVHAMRGISAHANGFHTCRMIHLLQILLGAIDCPGGFLYKPPYPKHCPPSPKPHGTDSKAGQALGGTLLGYPHAPEDLLLEADGSYCRIDKGFSWDYPLSGHGLMHMLIHNAANRDPYAIDVMFLYMSNMAWNSSMNIKDTLQYLTAKDDNGDYKIKFLIYADAYDSEMVSYADLVLPDTTYLERWDCISLLDRPISTAHSVADAIRRPVVTPDRDVRPFQDVLIELAGRLQLPGFTDKGGEALYKDYADYIVNHQRSPGIGPLAGWRGKTGNKHERGDVNKNQLQKYIDNGCFWESRLPDNMHYYRFANKDYLQYAKDMGWLDSTAAILLTPYHEGLQKFHLAAQGHGAVVPPENLRQRISDYFDPIAKAYLPFESEDTKDDYPLFAVTQRPMFHYHSWGSQNAWLRQIANCNYLYLHHDLADDRDIKDGDWIWVESRLGRIRVMAKRMWGCDKNTVWTWNAIGKRQGKWGLKKNTEECQVGFLLNHLIPENLRDGKISNADPVTGQAAWYDLRVRIYKCTEQEKCTTEPCLEMLTPLGVGEVDSHNWGRSMRRATANKGTPEKIKEWLGFGNKEGA